MIKDISPVADIGIIGSGMACTATLIALFEQLINNNHISKPPLQITVIERYHEMWKGIPYGNRSSVNALTITTINDFFTSDEERVKFFEWFLPNKAPLLKTYADIGGTTAKNWINDNTPALNANDWKAIYLPRFIIGGYVSQRLNKLVQQVEVKKLAVINTVQGNVTALKRQGKIKVITADKDKIEFNIRVKKAVLAIGSAPGKNLTNAFDQSQVLYINNLHDKNLEQGLSGIYKSLNALPPSKKNILVIGSNAGSIELLYLLNNTDKLKDHFDTITILSSGGKLPGHITYKSCKHHVTGNLDTLKKKSGYDIEQLVAAATQDILSVISNAVSIHDVDKIMGLTIKLLEPLDNNSKKLFYGIYGVQLARIFRRSGKDYKKASQTLLQTGKLIIIKGNYVDFKYNSDGTTTLIYKTADKTSVDLTNTFGAIINCTGSEDLVNNSSALIKDLLENNDFKINLSGKAFEVSDNLEAAPGIYVIGPLAGGNFNKLLHFWHIENASRIIYLSKFLAKELLK